MKVNWKNLVIIALSVSLLSGLGVGGYWYFNQNQSEDNSNNEESNNNQTDELEEGWKLYTNEEYGFSFQYPEDWTDNLQSPDSNIVDGQPAGGSITFNVTNAKTDSLDNEYETTVKDYDKDETPTGELKPQSTIDQKEYITLDKHKAIKFSGSAYHIWGWGYISTLAINNNKTYLISISYMKEEDREEFLNIYDKVISSFKFLN